MFTNVRGLGTLLVSSLLLPLAFAQTPAAAPQAGPSQANRIADRADLSAKTQLTHQLPGWVNPSRDAGQVPAGTEVGLTFILARSPQLQIAFEQLLADQQNPASAQYHQWLTPRQIGDQYGPTQHDIDAITAWLSTAGLTVKEVAPSKVFLHAYGPATAVGAALGTSFRMFTSGGKAHLSAASEPIIPAAFAQVIANIGGLTDVELHPMSHASAPDAASIPASTGQGGAHPNYTTGNGFHYVFPGDFAVLFDINPLYSAGLNGTGQRVAVIGRTTIVNSDITAFETVANLPANTPNTIIPTTGVNPGLVTNDESESDLDLERVIGTAPGITADFVTSGTANGFNGIYVAAQYEVQTVLDPILTLSYGACEYNAGASQVNLWSTLFAQAAAEGISVFVSSADSAVDTCDTAFQAPPTTAGTYQGPSINYICSNPYNTCVGGTEFVDTATPAAYWSATNSAGNTSALGYIPEGGWNDPGTAGSYIVQGSGGGASTFVAKPTFQAGVGVPADSFRDVPDVAFPASGHDGYFGCEADLVFSATSNGNCATNGGVIFSGTSAAAPSWAGVTALLNQKTGYSQGNLNPLVYRLAANTANGAFHDVTPATTGVANCAIGTPSLCNNTIPGSATSLTGGVQGFPVTIGYDQVTGWGSPDVAKFVAAAVLTDPGFTLVANPTSLTLTAGAATGNTASITYTSVQGFSGSIATTCSIVLTGGTATVAPTCTISPNPTTLAANGTATTTVTVTTVAPHAIARTTAVNQTRRSGLLGTASLAALLFCVSLRRRRLQAWRALAFVCALGLGLFSFTGCGGGGSSTTTPPTAPILTGGTTTGTYALTVIGSSSVSARATISVTIH